MFKFLTIFLLCVFGINGQIPIGKCPEIDSVKENFDLSKYLGRWYEAAKYLTVFEIGGRCNSAVYSLNDNGTVNVHNQQINKITGKPSSIEGTARPAGAVNEAKLIVNFPSAPVQFDAPYWVLDTDYDTYAVVWSCGHLPVVPLSAKFAWILTRERNPSEDTLNQAYAVFDKFNLNKKELIKTDQTNCPDDV